MSNLIPAPTPATGRARGNPQRNNPLPQNFPNDAISNVPAIDVVPETKDEELKAWVDSLYSQANMSDADLKSYWEAFSYKGFNRMNVLKQLKSVIPDVKVASQAILVVALRGPQQGSKVKLLNGKSLFDLKIPASGGQGTQILTCNKIQAATADLAAYLLKRLEVPKRIDINLPGWLQFPSAGGIKMPDAYRREHIEFSKRFSALIGGVFQEQIYMQMVSNAYLDPKLKLFD